MKTNQYRTHKNLITKAFYRFAGLALLLTLTASIASAQTNYPTPSLLAAKWWQWGLETPASENPLTDTTGQFAAVNQPNGNVWFLARLSSNNS